MTDAELMEFLHIENAPWRERFVASLSPERRALFERMAQLCMGVEASFIIETRRSEFHDWEVYGEFRNEREFKKELPNIQALGLYTRRRKATPRVRG